MKRWLIHTSQERLQNVACLRYCDRRVPWAFISILKVFEKRLGGAATEETSIKPALIVCQLHGLQKTLAKFTRFGCSQVAQLSQNLGHVGGRVDSKLDVKLGQRKPRGQHIFAKKLNDAANKNVRLLWHQDIVPMHLFSLNHTDITLVLKQSVLSTPPPPLLLLPSVFAVVKNFASLP